MESGHHHAVRVSATKLGMALYSLLCGQVVTEVGVFPSLSIEKTSCSCNTIWHVACRDEQHMYNFIISVNNYVKKLVCDALMVFLITHNIYLL